MLHIVGAGDLDVDRTRRAFVSIGGTLDRRDAKSVGAALVGGRTFVTDDALSLMAADGLEVIVEATGPVSSTPLPAVSVRGHVVTVNVEADALAEPLLSRRAAEAGILYSLSYGNQPALIAELVDWARLSGFEIVWRQGNEMPAHRSSETVWGHYGFTPAQVAAGDFNAKMFNSFLDGTRSAIEMAAVSNVTGSRSQKTASLSHPAASMTCRPSCGLSPTEARLRLLNRCHPAKPYDGRIAGPTRATWPFVCGVRWS